MHISIYNTKSYTFRHPLLKHALTSDNEAGKFHKKRFTSNTSVTGHLLTQLGNTPLTMHVNITVSSQISATFCLHVADTNPTLQPLHHGEDLVLKRSLSSPNATTNLEMESNNKICQYDSPEDATRKDFLNVVNMPVPCITDEVEGW
jgi:hypothetical protein